jgi:hypothetical protein
MFTVDFLRRCDETGPRRFELTPKPRTRDNKKSWQFYFLLHHRRPLETRSLSSVW